MERNYGKAGTKNNRRIRKFSTLHMEVFEQVLISSKTNRDSNKEFGYTQKSHCVVNYSRKVMFKLLASEELTRIDYMEEIVYPRKHKSWWMRLLDKHRLVLLSIAVAPLSYKNVNNEAYPQAELKERNNSL